MAKIIKKFTVLFPVTKTSVTSGRLEQIHLGDVVLNAVATIGFGEDDPAIDFDSIEWDGKDILPMLDNLTNASELMEQFVHAAFTYLYDVVVPEMQENDLAHA